MKGSDSTTDWCDLQIGIVIWGKACFTPVVLHPISYKNNYCKVYGYDQNSFVLCRNKATSSNHTNVKIHSRLSVANDEKIYIVV